jgi:hypothetical protein
MDGHATLTVDANDRTMRGRQVKATVLGMALVGCLWSSLVAAQPANLCDACIAGAGCDGSHQSCVVECRAHYFEIDPRRSQCIEHCSTAAAQCSRTAGMTCRTQNVCR